MTDIRTVGVIGAGQMGAGIAQVAAQAGYEVILSDIDLPARRRAATASSASLAVRSKRASWRRPMPTPPSPGSRRRAKSRHWPPVSW